MNTQFQVGGTVFPLPASTAHDILVDADPALAAALAFYKSVLNTHLGARWDAEVAAVGLPALVGKLTGTVVPYDPIPYLTQAQLTPPLLACYVGEDGWGELTRHRYRADGDWRLLWVLPPLTAAQHLRLSPFLRAAAKVIADRTAYGYDEAHAAGARVWASAGVDAVEVVRTRYGAVQALRDKTTLFFPAVEVELTVHEGRETSPGAEPLTGIDGLLQITDPADGPVDFAEIEVDTQ